MIHVMLLLRGFDALASGEDYTWSIKLIVLLTLIFAV